MSRGPQRWACGAGLIAGPLAWAINTQTSFALASRACETQRAVLTPFVSALIVLSVAGALVSAISMRATRPEPSSARGGSANRLLAVIGAGAGLLFAVVMANQLAALLMVGQCAR
jgi:hypothetical protein